jgi:hypothetical protein
VKALLPIILLVQSLNSFLEVYVNFCYKSVNKYHRCQANMVIANDTHYSGLHTDPKRLKHAAATKLALSVLFDGEPSNVHRFKSDFIDRMKNCRLHLKSITGSGGHTPHTHWARIQEALDESFTEKFCLQVMDWSKNWCKQAGEGHDWMMMQFLAKVDL